MHLEIGHIEIAAYCPRLCTLLLEVMHHCVQGRHVPHLDVAPKTPDFGSHCGFNQSSCYMSAESSIICIVLCIHQGALLHDLWCTVFSDS